MRGAPEDDADGRGLVFGLVDEEEEEDLGLGVLFGVAPVRLGGCLETVAVGVRSWVSTSELPLKGCSSGSGAGCSGRSSAGLRGTRGASCSAGPRVS